MKNDNQANWWALNVTVFVIFLPVLLYPQLIRVIKLGYIQSLIKGGHWLHLSVVVLMIALYVASIILVIWKGRLRLAVLTVFFGFFLLTVSFSRIRLEGSGAGPRQLVIYAHEPGIEVYCNDVYLGETPLKISEAEFHEKVKPWKTPPRQKIVIEEEFIEKIKTHRYESADTELRWFYIPYDYFDRHYDFGQPGSYSYDDAMKSLYWWRFEKDGCTGFAVIRDMVWFAYDDGQYFSIQSTPDLQHPSIHPYLKHLLHDLTQSNYQPSVEWETHVARSSGLLFQHLYEVGQRDSRVMRALEMAVQAEFGIHEGMPAQAWEGVLDEVMSRTKQRLTFRTPSPESMVMDVMMEHNTKLIETRFLELPSPRIQPWKIYEPGAFLMLKYAVLNSRPPALFKQLVYGSRDGGQFLIMVGNYSRPEALRLVRQYFNDVAHPHPVVNLSSPFSRGWHRSGALDVATQLRNPALEPELRRFVLTLVKANPDEFDRELREFIDARLEHVLTQGEADSLAEWVAEAIPLPEDEKLQFLTRINSARTYRYVRDIVRRQPPHQKAVVQNLIHHPNPSLDRFLIEAYQAESAIDPITVPPNLIRAMLRCDTPRMHTFLERIWNASDSNRIALLAAIKQEDYFPHLHRWTTLISEVEDVDTRLAAIPVLDQIDTPDASELLADWVLHSDGAVKREAERALANYRERSRLAKALLAGRVKPDDLLVGQTVYVWDGKNYVPEVPTAAEE